MCDPEQDQFESSPIKEKDNMGRDKFWEEDLK
jgi:hypothetical protein